MITRNGWANGKQNIIDYIEGDSNEMEILRKLAMIENELNLRDFLEENFSDEEIIQLKYEFYN